jgi:RIP metalloprotease RseP
VTAEERIEAPHPDGPATTVGRADAGSAPADGAGPGTGAGTEMPRRGPERAARVAGIVVFALAMAALTATGAIGVWLATLVVAPVVAAMALAEAGRHRESGWARVAAVAGLVVWLATVGGAPMLLVVAAVLAMIFLHELGHYMAARRAGMKVTEFFLGFGTRLWSFRRGETEFGIKAIPAGAYVKIIGMNNLEEVDPADEARTYRQGRFRDRMLVAVAGSGMHFALALVLLVVQFALIGRPSEDRWTVGSLSDGGAAQAAGIRSGDEILSFDGAPVGDYASFRTAIRAAEVGPAEVTIERGGEEIDLTVDLARRAKVIGTVGSDLDLVERADGLVVGPLVPNGRAEQAGLSEGQPVLGVNSVAVSSLEDLPAALDDGTGGAVTLTVAEPGSGTTREVTVDLGSAVSSTAPGAYLGVGAEPVMVTEGLPDAVGSAVVEFGRGIGLSVAGIGRVFAPQNLAAFFSEAVTGDGGDVADEPTPAERTAVSTDGSRPTSIIGAVAFGAELTDESLSNIIGFLIGLNVFIGVFNLIPLLPFDGGHVSIAVYEKAQELRLRRKGRYIADVSRMIPVAYTVVMVLAVVGLLAMYMDITKGVTT